MTINLFPRSLEFEDRSCGLSYSFVLEYCYAAIECLLSKGILTKNILEGIAVKTLSESPTIAELSRYLDGVEQAASDRAPDCYEYDANGEVVGETDDGDVTEIISVIVIGEMLLSLGDQGFNSLNYQKISVLHFSFGGVCEHLDNAGLSGFASVKAAFKERAVIGGEARGRQLSQEADELWRNEGLKIAIEARKANPSITQEKIAEQIQEKLGDDAPEGFRGITGQIRIWENDPKIGLPKRVAAPKKKRVKAPKK